MPLRKALLIALLALATPLPNNATFPMLNTNMPLPPITKQIPTTTLPQINSRALGPHTFPTNNMMNRTAALAGFRRISYGAQRFGLDLFTLCSDMMDVGDFMISPFAIWSLLVLLTEGAEGETLRQLRSSLHIDHEQQELRQAYRVVHQYLTLNTSTIEVATLQALFTDINQPVGRDFEQIIERDYGTALMPVNFQNPQAVARTINELVANVTHGLIQSHVQPEELENASLFMLSSLYFKGQWKFPFNRTLTHSEPFYDEDGLTFLGNVPMMKQVANFMYAGINQLESYILELPYGKEDRLSMFVILPKSGVPLKKVVRYLQQTGTEIIFESLRETANNFDDEDVEVIFPKFTTGTELALGDSLKQLGIVDIFDSNRANLTKMSENIFVQQVQHFTKIIVSEEGTEAAAVATATLTNKANPPKFYLNRPFLYLIMEKQSNLLLFAGQVRNPNRYVYQQTAENHSAKFLSG